jgi:prolipoprotein diacylglyceryl transferase
LTSTVLAYLPSPSQGVWYLGPVPIRAYALCIILGIVAALIIGDRRWAARGGEPGVIYDIALWAVPFGLVGGRLYHVMTDWPTYFGPQGKGLLAAFQVWEGGLGIWGAVALGGVGAWIACRRRGIPLPAFGDAIAPGIVLAQAIGRLGNYFNQELYGRATTLPWGLEIYQRVDASGRADNLAGVSNGTVIAVVHPTFLYELLWNLLVFALLIWVDRKFRIGHGRLFALYVAAYCVGRFWVELMRSDHASMPFADIRVNTFTSTFVFIGAVVYMMLAPKGREEPATLAGHRRDDTEESVIDEVGKELVGVAAATGVVAAAKVAGDTDADAIGDHSEDMHPDEVMADEGAEASAAIELKAIAPHTDVEEGPADEVESEEAVEETDEAAATEDETATEQVDEEAKSGADTDAVDAEVEPGEETDETEESGAEEAAEETGAVTTTEGEDVAETAEPEAEETEAEGVAVSEEIEESAPAEDESAAEPGDEEAATAADTGATEGEDVAEAAEPAAESVSEPEESEAEDAEAVEEPDEEAASDGESAEPAAETEQAEPEAEVGADVETEEPSAEAVTEESGAEESEAEDTGAAEVTDEAAATEPELPTEQADEAAKSDAEPEPEATAESETETETDAAESEEPADEAVSEEPEESEAAESGDEATDDAQPETSGAAEDEPDSTPAEADESAESAKPEPSQVTPAAPTKPATPAPTRERRRWWRRRR